MQNKYDLDVVAAHMDQMQATADELAAKHPDSPAFQLAARLEPIRKTATLEVLRVVNEMENLSGGDLVRATSFVLGGATGQVMGVLTAYDMPADILLVQLAAVAIQFHARTINPDPQDMRLEKMPVS